MTWSDLLPVAWIWMAGGAANLIWSEPISKVLRGIGAENALTSPGAIKVGGWVAISAGLSVLAMAITVG